MKINKLFIQKHRYEFLIGLIAICAACLITAVLLIGAFTFKKSAPPAAEEFYPDGVYSAQYKVSGTVGYSAEYLGYTDRRIPSEIKNEGYVTSGRYPDFGRSLPNITQEEKEQLITESKILMASGTKQGSATITGNQGGRDQYNMMDKDGKLYYNGTPANYNGVQRTLYKHTASVGMWYGDVSDSEKAIIKRIKIQARTNTNHITGLYAPAGEVIKIQMSEADFRRTNGLAFFIGQAFPRENKSNDIWAARGDFSRMPIILNRMDLTANTATLENGVYTCYIGSFLGGPIYVKPYTASSSFTVTISGAVPYKHFILGSTTEAEFEMNAKSSAPYFDMEIFNRGCRFSGGKKYATKVNGSQLSYGDLYKACIYWQKVMGVSMNVGNLDGIVFLYEPFVAAGALVAFVGNDVVNAPPGYMPHALDYDTLTSTGPDGLWGNMHELNHHFQSGWGLPNGGEVSNNALSLVSYSLYTNISANRALGNSSEGSYGCGWDHYTNPSWSLRNTLGKTGANYDLDAYSTILHNIGQDSFLAAIRLKGGSNVDAWYRATSNASKTDMTYFFQSVLHLNPSADAVEAIQNQNYPMTVPIATIYQTGKGYCYGAPDSRQMRYFNTAQPYKIRYGEDFDIDLTPYTMSGSNYASGSIVLPAGFSYRIKGITNPQYGSITKKSENIYTYHPSAQSLRSGKIYVTVEITKDDGEFAVADTELVLEFNQSHEMNRNVLQRRIYTYTAENMYADAQTAFKMSYAGYETYTDGDSKNPTQNTNTDIRSPDPAANAVMEVRGKYYISSAGKYRIALRGRGSVALYIAINEDSGYTLAAAFNRASNANANFELNNADHYKEMNFEAGTWVYFKAVLVVTNRSFIGVGRAECTTPSFTIREIVNDDQTVTVKYYNADGQEVTQEEAMNAKETAPTSQSAYYTNAYRNSYQFTPSDFVTEDAFPRTYAAGNYSESTTKGTVVDCRNYTPFVHGGVTYNIEYAFDDNPDTFAWSNQRYSADDPFVLTVDLGEEKIYNRMEITAYSSGYSLKNFTVLGGTSLNDLHVLNDFKNAGQVQTQSFNFTAQKIRYYRIIITSTYRSDNQITLRSVKLLYNLSGGRRYSPDDDMFTYLGNWGISTPLCTFGHIYEGETDAVLEFVASGKTFGIYSFKSEQYGKFDVYIDGVKVATVDINSTDGAVGLAYVSPLLESGKHLVTIKCIDKVNIDSIAIW